MAQEPPRRLRTRWRKRGEGAPEALDPAGGGMSSPVSGSFDQGAAAVELEDPGEFLSQTVCLRASVPEEMAIAGVEFQVAVAESFEWQALGVVSQPLFEVEFDTALVEDGVYDLRAVAHDKRGGFDASRILRGRRVDNVAPTVALLEPAAGALLHGEVPLSARATDTGSGVKSALFQFSGDGTTWRPVVARSGPTGAVYWDTTRIADGDYRLRAVAGDAAGNLATSDLIEVRVDNTP
jgi:hypothetical protein